MWWQLAKTAFAQWGHHRTPRLGAALAYYSVFSIGPLLLIATVVASFFFNADVVRSDLTRQFRSLLGEAGSSAVEAMLDHAFRSDAKGWAALIGVVLLLVAAVGVVAQLKDAMNTIWNVRDPKTTTIWWYVRTYLVSFAGVLAVGFLLAVSLIVSTVLSALSTFVGSTDDSLIWQGVDLVVSILILAVLFGALFKFFPDTPVEWRDVIAGAIFTSVLFNVGKWLIGWYVGTQALDTTYGPIGAILVLLVWVYYSAQILLLGAEFTHAYATTRGSRKNRGPEGSAPHKADLPA